MSAIHYEGLSPEEVQYVLTNYEELSELRYLSGDSAASDILITIDSAITDSDLSEEERQLLDLRFNKHLKLDAISAIIGKPTYKISRIVKRICVKIADNTLKKGDVA